MENAKWLNDTVSYYHKLGFFQKFGDISDEDLVKKLQQQVPDLYFGEFSSEYPDEMKDPRAFTDLVVLSFDTTRVWFVEDSSHPFGKTDHSASFYDKVFEKLSEISQGQFKPENLAITKVGESAEGQQMEVTFSLNGKEEKIVFSADGSVLVLTFLKDLNACLNSKFTFEAFQDPYGTVFVVFLSKEEKEKLKADREWMFTNL